MRAKKAAKGKAGPPDCDGVGLRRVVLGQGVFACNDVDARTRGELGWPNSLPCAAWDLVGKRVRLVAEVLP